MPFLVDSMRMALDRHGLGVHLLVHPMLDVERDEQQPPDRRRALGRDGLVEAWTQIEIDRCDDAMGRRSRPRSQEAIGEVRRAVADYPPMRDRLDVARRRRSDPALAGQRPLHVPRRRRLRPEPDGTLTLAGRERARPGRDDARVDDPPPMPGDGARHRPHRHTVDDPSQPSVECHLRAPDRRHRRAAVLRTARRRTPTGPASSTSRRSGRSCAECSTSARRGPHSYPGRADAQRAREPAPRSRARAGRHVPGPAGDRHRRSPGTPAGARVRGARARWAMVHGALLPAAQPVHWHAARARRRHRRRGLRRRAARPGDDDRRQHTGAHRRQRAAPGPTSASADLGALERVDRRAVDVVGRSGSARRWSPKSARTRAASCTSASVRTLPPATRRRAPRPRHRRRPAHRRAARRRRPDRRPPSVTTSMRRTGEWRFRIYRRECSQIVLAELLPLLDQLGPRGPRRAPYVFHSGDERCSSTTSACASRRHRAGRAAVVRAAAGVRRADARRRRG